MSEPVSISTGIAERYATAVFELATETNSLDALEADIDTLRAALAESPEFAALIASPVVTRGEQAAAIDAIAVKAGLGQTLRSTLGLMASKRRLFVLPQLLTALRALIDEAKGVVTAQVAAAKELTKAQEESLSAALKSQFGKEVNISMSVDESLIGGMVVRVGSKMIDTSIKAKLANLQNSMKEVG